MESISFIIVLEIVFFAIYRWGTGAERVNDFPAVLTRTLRQREGLALAWLRQANGGKGAKDVTKCVIYQPYTQSHKLTRSKEMSKAY